MTSSSEAAPVPGPAGVRVVVGVSGSIAAYKAPFVIRLLREAGHEVKVVATQAALRFIGAPALAAVSGRPVSTGVFDDPAAVEHVAVAEWAELVLIAPASADLLARLRAGRADDLLTATVLATQAPVLLAPAMHTQMWLNPATRDNVEVLRSRGLEVLDPDAGRLTGSDTGLGRLPEPERIVAAALALLTPSRAGTGRQAGEGAGGAAPGRALRGRHLVISAGGTREPIDPVRFLGNRSSGRQGCALAAAAADLGARVTLVQAHVERALLEALPAGVETLAVSTALEMEEAVRRAGAQADAVIMAAAVADYRPAHVAQAKIKKRTGAQAHPGPAGAAPAPIELVENPDILAGLVSRPLRPGQLVMGFAAETGDEQGGVLDHGAAKARRKGADLLAVNAVGEGVGFGDVPNSVVVLDRHGQEVARAQGSKEQVARALIGLLAQRLETAQGPDPQVLLRGPAQHR
ncbi:bifunctional phosphopantothenoylcysteine decarboxylase/phosphopantothenate--cysteine ligase CoaBC [Actinomyces bowdenii]|uniref:bifunctional phosphopantothenoylcysteine decarboxylase/phosphopantothenate--cysteine ligase CoaBC n=1 Tax=Actinomyces bowdenii TaxID=131109 RepID=UPI00214CE635|nr:bifunctional phosphopantothenoylcysteine decarboxylase/phosphopantothenate--cysteine ligase CoaBC [Actinomyces bowdenii]MCR2052287.1 bifunctional phosphopantothenoylcysteine decarboxylase/phosphopantothenate--cysteine ligase CoaBC [Actinomyces bowdenii]